MSRKVGIILTTIIAVILGLWLWAAIIPKDSTQIGGSTSVDPVMQRLTNTYKKEYKGDSFIYSSSGSTGGVNNAKSGTYKIGFISRALGKDTEYVSTTPTLDMNKANDQSYKELGTEIYNYLINDNGYSGNQMHYVQIATDAIILTYDAPQWFKDNFSPIFNITDANEKDIKPIVQKIYGGKYTWTDVANDLIKVTGKNDLNKFIENEKDVITPFARETGSGTRNSFDSEFGLGANNPNDPTSPSRATEYNSNGMMYNNFRINTFGYMSLNYLNQIQNNNELETVRVNNINPHDDKNFMDDIDANKNAADKYTLTRPYIGLIKWNLPNKEMKKVANFLAWIATASQEDAKANNAKEQFNKAGLKPEFKLDDQSIPGYKPATPKAEEVQDSTASLLKQTINEGYLPRH